MLNRRLLLAPALLGLAAFGALIQSGASQPAPRLADCATVISLGSIWIGSNCGKSGGTVIAPLGRQPITVPAESTREQTRPRRGARRPIADRLGERAPRAADNQRQPKETKAKRRANRG